MNIWKLSVTNPDSQNWEASTHKGDVIVRAKDERQARMAANQAFIIATKKILGRSIKLSPWEDSEDTKCELIENGKYSTEGEPCVLEPEHT
ncbi:MAG: hypothetical protein IIA06_07560 [Proteobacteria bacterium]|nr:hypothetical protein [Pseudomonadota bacterium]